MLKKKEIALFVGIFLFSFIFPSVKAWWNASWQLRKPITITNNGGSISYYQIAVNITYDSDMQPDFSDIRFANSSDYELPYWVENKVNSQWAYVWVKVPYLPVGNSTIYVYYKNSTQVNSTSNGDAVFIFFDDFSSDLSKWNYDAGVSIENGRAKIVRTSTSGHGEIWKNFDFNFTNVSLDFEFQLINTNSYGWVGGFGGGGTGFGHGYSYAVDWSYNEANYLKILRITNDGGSMVSIVSDAKTRDTNLRKQSFIWNASQLTIVWNDSVQLTAIDTTYQTRYNIFIHLGGGANGCGGYVDNVRLRNYTYPEPSFSIGSEESTNQPPQITIFSAQNITYYSIYPAIWANFTITDAESSNFFASAWLDEDVFWGNENYENNSFVSYNLTFAYEENLLSDGTHNLTVFANDSTNAVSSSIFFTIRTFPKYSNISISHTFPQPYGTHDIYFNISWKDEKNNLDKVWIRHNFTGEEKDYVMQINGDHYYYILNFAAGAGNYTYAFYANDTAGNQNQTEIFSFEITKIASGLSLSASPSWDVAENTPVAVSCSANSPLMVTLYKEGIVISNPYSTVLPYGFYNFTCMISDTQNYTPASISYTLTVQPGGFGCTNVNTFAFRKKIDVQGDWINIDFSNLVSQNLTKSDLSDVYVNTSNITVYRNGTYLVVNVSLVNEVEVLFGNYISSYSYPYHALSTNTTNMTNYEEINPYYILSLIDEDTGIPLLPPQANTTISLFCTGGTSSFGINTTKILISAFSQPNMIRTTVTYSATEIYYRDLLVRSMVEYKNVYVADANKNQVLQMLFRLNDMTGKFEVGSTFKAKRYLGGTLQTITELPFDAELKAIAYLLNGFYYQIYVDNGNEERSIGNIYTDPSSLEKSILIADTTYTNITLYNISIELNMSGNIIYFNYHDPSSQTNEVDFYVYNETNKNLLYYASSTNRSTVSFSYIVPDENGVYNAYYEVHHEYFGNNTFGSSKIFGMALLPISFPLLTLISYVGGNSMWFLLFFLFPIPLFFNQKNVGIGIITLIGIVSFLNFINVLTIRWEILGFALLIAILTEIWYRRRIAA